MLHTGKLPQGHAKDEDGQIFWDRETLLWFHGASANEERKVKCRSNKASRISKRCKG